VIGKVVEGFFCAPRAFDFDFDTRAAMAGACRGHVDGQLLPRSAAADRLVGRWHRHAAPWARFAMEVNWRLTDPGGLLAALGGPRVTPSDGTKAKECTIGREGAPHVRRT